MPIGFEGMLGQLAVTRLVSVTQILVLTLLLPERQFMCYSQLTLAEVDSSIPRGAFPHWPSSSSDFAIEQLKPFLNQFPRRF